MERSNFIAGVAGVMALILIMVGVYLFEHMPSRITSLAAARKPVAVAIVTPTTPAPQEVLLLPPPVFTKPVPRAVISSYHPKPTVIKFSKLENNFTGTWAAYPQLCNSAWYQISGKQLNVAGGGSCDIRSMQSAITSSTTVTSATVMLDCHHTTYDDRETWNLTQPRKGALNIRLLNSEGSDNAISLYRCPTQTASN